MKQTVDQKIELAAIQALAYDIATGLRDASNLPDALTFETRLGDEGPGSYTRITGLEITEEMKETARRESRVLGL